MLTEWLYVYYSTNKRFQPQYTSSACTTFESDFCLSRTATVLYVAGGNKTTELTSSPSWFWTVTWTGPAVTSPPCLPRALWGTCSMSLAMLCIPCWAEPSISTSQVYLFFFILVIHFFPYNFKHKIKVTITNSINKNKYHICKLYFTLHRHWHIQS